MEQKREKAYWTSGKEPLAQYPWLTRDERCEVLVIGGGLTGALIGYRLAEAGLEVCLLSRLPVGYGMTAFSFGAVEADADLSLLRLGKRIGREQALGCFRRYGAALDRLDALCGKLDPAVQWERKDLLSYAADPECGDFFQNEYLIRRHNGFPVSYVDRASTRDSLSFPVEDGIRFTGGGAQFDPYRLTQELVRKAAEEYRLRCYENTEVVSVQDTGSAVVAETAGGRTVTAGQVVFAAGAAACRELEGFLGRRSLSAVVTAPIRPLTGYDDALLLRQEEGQSFRVRRLPGDRLMILGEDSLSAQERFPGYGKLRELRYRRLTAALEKMFCGAGEIRPEYACTLRYRSTPDRLPVLGEKEGEPRLFFCLDSGPESLLTAELAAELLLAREPDPFRRLFSPERLRLLRPASVFREAGIN